jgi:hypothetical protein
VKLLGFCRPPTDAEKLHFFLRPQTPSELYPAAALEEIGKPALPAILDVIKFSSSAKARENAVFAWMIIYKYEAPKGVSLLRQEAVGNDNPAVKENLKWALSKAQMECYSEDIPKCMDAAKIPEP